MSELDRFRINHRPLTTEEEELIKAIKLAAMALEDLIDRINEPYRTIAMEKLEEVVMWAVKGITQTGSFYSE
jgi:hypothetical protein